MFISLDKQSLGVCNVHQSLATVYICQMTIHISFVFKSRLTKLAMEVPSL